MRAARVVITQGASLNLNLFSSREAEYEQRAQLLKRLSFTIYCSEVDQYQRHMPDIQGTVVMSSVPGHAVFMHLMPFLLSSEQHQCTKGNRAIMQSR